MRIETFQADIPIDMACAAHRGTSFVPEDRAAQERASYAAALAADLANLERHATTDDKRELLAEEFQRYREGYRKRYLAHLGAKSRCMSTMITGGSNFPTARNAKRNASADKRREELLDFRERAVKAILRKLRPELAPIMAGDDDAVMRLRAKLATLETERDDEKRANAALRKAAKALGRPSTLTDHIVMIAALAVPDRIKSHLSSAARAFPWLPQFGANTGAEIRRVEQRIEALSRAKATPDTTTVAANARIEESPADNRIRVYFPGKPAAEVRSTLKAAGFRWARTLPGVPWQAYINHGTRAVARAVAGIIVPVAPAPDPEAAPDCACHLGQHCNVSHDPAVCDCGRCGP